MIYVVTTLEPGVRKKWTLVTYVLQADSYWLGEDGTARFYWAGVPIRTIHNVERVASLGGDAPTEPDPSADTPP
jgi:hypothetical protein